MDTHACTRLAAGLLLVAAGPSGLLAHEGGSIPPELARAYGVAVGERADWSSEDGGESWTADNPAHGWRADLTRGGLELRGGGTDEGSWTFGLRLRAWGRGSDLTAVPAGRASACEKRVEIRRGDLTEWYVNEERGVEQGFTVARPPGAGSGPEALRLVLAVDDGFSIEVTDDGRGAVFTETDGDVEVHYSGLGAWDAGGEPLAASLIAEEGRLVLSVDDGGAEYPLTIDPWIWTREAKLLPYLVGVRDFFGNSVAVDGDTALIGAPGQDEGGADTGLAYVFTREGTDWALQATLAPPGGVAWDAFGRSVALDGDTALVGSPGNDEGGANAGVAYVFRRSGSTWSLEAKLAAADGSAEDFFGQSVALDGDSALVSAYGDDDAGFDSGSVYVFARLGSTWSEEAKLVADDGEPDDAFGWSVALDGDTALVGAPYEDTWMQDRGAAYVFVRSGSLWTQQAKRTPGDVSKEAWFGYCVSLDGDTALIGAPWQDSPGREDGAAYVYVRSGTAWTAEAKLDGPVILNSRFGHSTSLSGDTAIIGSASTTGGKGFVYTRSGTLWSQQAVLDSGGYSLAVDGDRALLGAPVTSFDTSGRRYGTAALFLRAGSSWTPEAEFDAGYDGETATRGYGFGSSVGMDGNTTLIGAPGGRRAYVFLREGTSWTRQAVLAPADGEVGDGFGRSVAIDGDTAVIGAYLADDLGSSSGAAHVFLREGTSWTEQAKLTADDGLSGDWFGFAVAIDGDTVLIGAKQDDVGAFDSGSVYVFVRTGSSWSQQAKLVPLDQEADDHFGYSVSLEGDTALIGAPSEDWWTGAQRSAAYVFTRQGSTWTEQAKLDAQDPILHFGCSVSLDGDTALIGAWGDKNEQGRRSGAAHVFVRGGSSWSEQAKLSLDDGVFEDYFGISVSLAGDMALIGASGHDAVSWNGGAAFVFTRKGSLWTLQSGLYGDPPSSYWGPFIEQNFGHAVALEEQTAVVGAYADADDGRGSGSVYIFTGSAHAHALPRNAGSNPHSLAAVTLPVLGGTYVTTVDLAATTGHDLAWLLGYATPLDLPLSTGQVLLINIHDPRGELLAQPLLSGPLATYSIPIPSDPALAGFEIATQALHFGGLQPFALSNAMDLMLGY